MNQLPPPSPPPSEPPSAPTSPRALARAIIITPQVTTIRERMEAYQRSLVVDETRHEEAARKMEVRLRPQRRIFHTVALGASC